MDGDAPQGVPVFLALIYTPMNIAGLINAERSRQEQLAKSGKFRWTCAHPDMPLDERVAVLVEEIGEVASAHQAYSASPLKPKLREHLITELIQVAAVCVAWCESLAWSRDGVIARIIQRSSSAHGNIVSMTVCLGKVVSSPSPEHVVALEDLAAESLAWVAAL